MANKRMFNIKIVDSDAFLDMPLSTQCLYFHLNMRADDDGFVGNPKRIQRLIGASDDDLKLLIAKRFVLIFEDGVIVIKHWRMHNTIQKDRYTMTAYTDELKQLTIKENKSYSLGVNIVETNCIQNDNTDIGIGLDTDIDIDKEKETAHEQLPPPQKKSKSQKHKYGNYQKVLLTDVEKEKLDSEYGIELAAEIIQFLDEYKEMNGKSYKNDYLAIKKWVADAVHERKLRSSRTNQFYSKQKKVIPMPDYLQHNEQPASMSKEERQALLASIRNLEE